MGGQQIGVVGSLMIILL